MANRKSRLLKVGRKLSSSTIDKKLEIFESICELKMTMNFESIFEKYGFEPIFEGSVNFEFFVNG